MQYLGGKKSIAKELACILESYRSPVSAPFYDVFAGSLAITAEMSGERHANDGNLALINMYRAHVAGWRPAEHVTFEEHARYRKTQDPADPMTAFVAHGCSFGGMWFSTYARDRSPAARNFAVTAARSLVKTLAKCQDVTLTCCDYRKLEIPAGALAYCDPPYVGTTAYAGMPKFDTDEFWATMDAWVARGVTVLVSEYRAPEAWREVWTRPVRKSRLAGNRVERLFHRA